MTLLGVNLAGAEFGTSVPGVFGTDYTYPTHAEIDYLASKGMGVIRLPFLWERLQRAELGPLDAAELGRLDDIVNYATGKGLKIEIEPHNYGYGFGALIGSAQTPNSSLADLWGKLALHYTSNTDVIFGLMNEPHDQSASQWLSSANAAIAAIRSAGATQQILVPGKLLGRRLDMDLHGQCRGRRHRGSRPRPQFRVRGPPVSRRGWQRHPPGRRLSNYWRRASDRDHAMGGSERNSFVPRRSWRQH